MSQQTRPPAQAILVDDASGEESLSWTQIQHFLHAPLRHPVLVVLVWLGTILLAIVAQYTLPKKYRSSTLILVESQKVPDSFVARVATQDSSRRIENIRPEILSRTRLERVVAEINPYPEIPLTRAVDAMRASSSINQSGSDGFTIEFVHGNPETAQKVADRLATLFIDEATKARQAQVGEAIDFLVTQVNEARKELDLKDEALRRYKETRMGRLPEQLETNLATMDMFQREMQTVEESLYLAREKRDALARSVGRRASAGVGAAPPPDPDDPETLRRQLLELRSRYTEEHPDVRSLRSRLARAEARARAASPATAAPDTSDFGDSVTREQIERVDREIARFEARQTELETRIRALRGRVEDTPRTEQELSNMSRDYNKLKENYATLLARQLEAQMAGRLEQRWKGDQFRVLDPANLPEKPYSPKATRIIGLGIMLGLLLGLGLSVAVEALDPTVKDAESLRNLSHLPVLASIPHLPDLSGPASR